MLKIEITKEWLDKLLWSRQISLVRIFYISLFHSRCKCLSLYSAQCVCGPSGGPVKQIICQVAIDACGAGL